MAKELALGVKKINHLSQGTNWYPESTGGYYENK